MGDLEATALDYGKVYSQMHQKQKIFPGFSACQYAVEIAKLVDETNADRLLDYGSGKGYQYLVKRVHETWGGILPICYDPGVTHLDKKPEGKFDGVICTDVMEHIDRVDIDPVLEDIFSYATKFVFLGIACRPAKRKKLPDGRNVHLTVEPPHWWQQKVEKHLRKDLLVTTVFDERDI